MSAPAYDEENLTRTCIARDPTPRWYIFTKQKPRDFIEAPPTSHATEPEPKSNAATRALHCEDLVVIVLSHFRQDSYSYEETEDLLNYMLVNKTFFPHAAALRWSECTDQGLGRLLNIVDFSPDTGPLDYLAEVLTCSEHSDEIVDALATITRSIAWNHFLYYASLIKVATLHAGLIDDCGLLPFFSALVPDGSPLLCSLQRLLWDQGPIGDESLMYMLGNSLVSLHVGVISYQDHSECKYAFSDWAARFMSAVSVACPKLEELSISSRGPALTNSVSSSALYFENLHRLPVQVLEQDSVGFWNERSTPAAFQNLIEVGLSAMQGSSGLFSGLDLAIPLFASTLRSVSIISLRVAWYTDVSAFRAFISPLLALHELVSVTVTLPHHIVVFGEDDLITLALCWPKLESLELSFSCDPSNCGLELQSLTRAAELCPSLAHLCLPAIRCPEKPADAALPTVPNSQLMSLVIYRVYFTTVVTRNVIVQVLCDAFPLLDAEQVFLCPLMLMV